MRLRRNTYVFARVFFVLTCRPTDAQQFLGSLTIMAWINIKFANLSSKKVIFANNDIGMLFAVSTTANGVPALGKERRALWPGRRWFVPKNNFCVAGCRFPALSLFGMVELGDSLFDGWSNAVFSFYCGATREFKSLAAGTLWRAFSIRTRWKFDSLLTEHRAYERGAIYILIERERSRMRS